MIRDITAAACFLLLTAQSTIAIASLLGALTAPAIVPRSEADHWTYRPCNLVQQYCEIG